MKWVYQSPVFFNFCIFCRQHLLCISYQCLYVYKCMKPLITNDALYDLEIIYGVIYKILKINFDFYNP